MHNLTLKKIFPFLAIILVIVVAPWLAPNDPEKFLLSMRFTEPSLSYPLGTDQFGRCILSRLLYGFRITPLSAFTITIISLVIGCVIGLYSGYRKGIFDLIMGRIIESFFIFPALAIALVVAAILGNGMISIILSLTFVHWTEYARMSRNLLIKEKEKEYVKAAEMIGLSRTWVMYKHILPNIFPAIFAMIPYSMSWAILSFAGLSYLGLGAEVGSPEWGLMIAEGRTYMREYPMLIIAPGILIISTIIIITHFGEKFNYFSLIKT